MSTMTAPSDTMAPAKVPSNLPELVKTAFARARASGDVHFFPTQVTLISVNSIPFQLRFSPSLAAKPKAPLPAAPSITTNSPSLSPSQEEQTRTQEKNKKPFFDPFDNPPAPMLITPLGPTHNLVLNKFAVVPEHFILATTAFKEQTHLLEPQDLAVAYACVEAYHSHHHQQSGGEGDEEEGGLFVFFNSGPHSGASQPHRHIQMLPIERMKEGLEGEGGGGGGAVWGVLAAGLVHSARGGLRGKVPFETFAEGIGKHRQQQQQQDQKQGVGEDLHAVYLRLYRRACEAVLGSGWADDGTDGGAEGDGREARISYNLGMTRDVMVIVPRVAEGQAVTVPAEEGGEGRKEVGKLALNGTVLAGTALVKSQAEWDALRAEPEQLLEILGRIGVPAVQAPPLL